MGRLIDADKLISWIDPGHLRHPSELCFSEIDVVNILNHAPTVDAVPVVRCKDCRKNGTTDCGMSWTNVFKCIDNPKLYAWNKDNDFCSWGERKRKDD